MPLEKLRGAISGKQKRSELDNILDCCSSESLVPVIHKRLAALDSTAVSNTVFVNSTHTSTNIETAMLSMQHEHTRSCGLFSLQLDIDGLAFQGANN